MLRKDFEVTLLVNGNSVKEYHHEGNVFVEGKEGSEFSIKVTNNSWRRVLAVLTIDGKSIVNGEPGSIEESNGYVLAPYSSSIIPGWRLDNNAVAKFLFSKNSDSYAARSGEGIVNVGVIGCAFFFEEEATKIKCPECVEHHHHHHEHPWVYPVYPIWYGSGHITCGATYSTGSLSANNTTKCSTRGTSASTVGNDNQIMNSVYTVQTANSNATGAVMDSCCTTTSAPVSSQETSKLGTAFGEQASHAVSETEFNRMKDPEAVFVIYYDTREGLKNRGVSLQPVAQVCASPFPASTKFCKPPVGWQPKK